MLMIWMISQALHTLLAWTLSSPIGRFVFVLKTAKRLHLLLIMAPSCGLECPLDLRMRLLRFNVPCTPSSPGWSPILKCGVRVYLDDVLIFAPSLNEFVQLLDRVHLLSSSGFKVSLDKCKFPLQVIKFLGFILSKNGKHPDPAKVEAILRIPRSTNSKAVLSWLQTANFYLRFVKDFSRIAAPLKTTIRSQEFVWTDACDEAFERIRKALTEAPQLGHFDQGASTTVTTDASETAVGAVHGQEIDYKFYFHLLFVSTKLPHIY